MHTNLPAQAVTEREAAPAENMLAEILLGSAFSPAEKITGIAIGTLQGFTATGLPVISVPALEIEHVPARSMVVLGQEHITKQLAIGFEMGDPRQPFVLGIMLEQITETAATTATTAQAHDIAQEEPEPEEITDILLDGERMVFSAEREIELRCGEAALILSSDGRIELRGTYITSHASATQRILGGSVSLN